MPARRPLIAGDVVVMGSSINDSAVNKEMPPGYVQAYDVRTGNHCGRSARFREPVSSGPIRGKETPLSTRVMPMCGPGWVRPGVGLCLLAVVDSDERLLWRPSPREQSVCRDPDLRGGEDRQTGVAFPGGSSRSLGLRFSGDTGSRRHHGRRPRIKAVMQPSKQAFLYVFDRKTGQPVWPIEERPVPQSTVPANAHRRLSRFPPNLRHSICREPAKTI